MPIKYKILDSADRYLGMAFSDDSYQKPLWRLTFSAVECENVMKHEFIKLVVSNADIPPIEGKILYNHGNVVTVRGMRIRENLRIPVNFNTFIIPIDGKWVGRRKIISHDISCGGFAFYSDEELFKEEMFETVVPITSQPLVLRVKVLRKDKISTKSDKFLYAGEFYEMLHEEEIMVREAVFNLQKNYMAKD